MTKIVIKAIADFKRAQLAYTKFTTPNNVGATGSHEAGWLIGKTAWPLFFDRAGVKGELLERFIQIKWQDDFDTTSRFIYYGQKTRNEYRLTRFGRGFPFLREENIGDYIVLMRLDPDTYKAYVLRTDEEIEDFTTAVGISVANTNELVVPEKSKEAVLPALSYLIEEVAASTQGVMPTSTWIANKSLELNIKSGVFIEGLAISNPDYFLLTLIKTEYELFKAIERYKYKHALSGGFGSVDDFIKIANSVLNSRKSRAGHSLENHLATVFDKNTVQFETQVITEGKKKADFILPNGKAYHDPHFLIENLFFMAAKTTCKDRWRQILNEADRLPISYLMTLQQGISKNQLEEMKAEQVVLVVPKYNLSTFPAEYRKDIMTLSQFIYRVKCTQL